MPAAWRAYAARLTDDALLERYRDVMARLQELPEHEQDRVYACLDEQDREALEKLIELDAAHAAKE